MTSIDTSIITAFQELGISEEDIAEQEGVEVETVKAILMQYVPEYRTKVSSDINSEDKEEILSALKNIGLYGENEGVRAKVLRYLYDEAKGRNDKREENRLISGMKVGALIINHSIQRAKSAKSRMMGSPKTIDILPMETATKGE